ncbi:hypothetical protein FIE12Z_4130 [Fusarium flagelliforme]|uniref:Uncharacterized protein n=1 Tax=Fusarium flagelliforme TaxID=2675880 RepID=A0A395MUP6_9HYPO|nr:hypothetical protein FIE12Z_4130 [Fusarium flagelliforme]
MVAISSNLASNNIPTLTSIRAPRSISDNSGRRGRVIFRPRRHVRAVHRPSTSQRRTQRPLSSPVHILSSNSSNGSSNTKETITNGPGTQNHSRLKRDTQPRPGISTSSGCAAQPSSATSKDEHRPVNPLHISEMNGLTPPRRVLSSTHQDRTKTMGMHKYAMPSQVLGADVFGGTSTTENSSNVNNELMEAISRNIAQQLQLLSIKDESPSTKYTHKKKVPPTSDSLDNESRTPSQKEALDRFTQELCQYAEQSGAKGKLPIFTPTPPQSGASLRTIAALLPFRSEFKAAGLAITSKDQATHPSPRGKPRATKTTASKPSPKQPHLAQVDSATRCPSSSIEIPFPAVEDMDEWRPLYSEAPEKEAMTGPISKVPRSHMHSYPEWLNMVSPGKRTSCQRRDHANRVAKSYSRPAHSKQKQKQTTAAFFSSPKAPVSRSNVSKRSIASQDAGPSSNIHRPRAEIDTRTRVSRATKPDRDQNQSSHAKSTRPPKSPSHAVPVYNSSRRGHSLSADVVVPQRTESARKPEKSLPDLPQPESSKTSIEEDCDLSVEAGDLPLTMSAEKEDCRLFAEADASLLTPKTVFNDKGKGKASHMEVKKERSSSISPNHVTVCSRGFSGRKIGRPNVPKRTSSIRSLREKSQDDDQVAILDRDVLRGLHIAASAACNEQIDAFIREKTGLHIRQFLSDLTPFESLGNNPTRDAKERRAKRRRAEIREVKQKVRRSRQMRKRTMS